MTDRDIIRIQEVTKDFGGLRALNDISFGVKKGEIKAIIGPNGAGKTTLFNVMTGVFPSTLGKVFFKNKDITRRTSHEIASLGISRTFQNVRLFTFKKMTVLQNVLIGGHRMMNSGIFSAALWLPRVRREDEIFKEKAMEVLDFVGLRGVSSRVATSIPFGQQRLLEISRALMLSPEVMLIDEPAAGLNDSEIKNLIAVLLRIREKGITILLIEHHMGLVMSISDEVVVLNFGQLIAQGTPTVIQNDANVVAAYLGKEA